MFKLTLNPSTGTYTESVLHTFGTKGFNDGHFPVAGLLQDARGNLYGTTEHGGNVCNEGTVFKLTFNPSTGTYTESVLYEFGSNGVTDGARPTAGLIQDKSGNLYGTTTEGGNGVGTVFKLTLNALGAYTESVLYRFGAIGFPQAELLQDIQGNLYGTTEHGGQHNHGSVFKLTLNPSSGTYTESVLHAFAGERDGAAPLAGLILDASGHLYGTTYSGGGNASGNADGTVFEITPETNL
ncbi:hypothetical protein EO087_06700 [Dyella sp. M7H15-1]|nr:choice-of-anchor tandem repeat GloVer-containing protein [Dyella sp. M7H15-1]QAU23710.1 hypothetical protein EO087_06700 [Dyella sp. M7H15-1]